MEFTELLEECKEYLKDNPDALTRIAKMQESRAHQAFRVALAGGMSRGKTRIINQLLDTDLLPESHLPTTAVLTEIVYGTEPEIEWITQSGAEKLPVATTSLERFSAQAEDGEKAGMLKVKWPAPFLKPRLKLYDTPGNDDLITSQANMAHELLEMVEGAVIVVSATNPMSLQESELIKSYLRTHPLPKLAILVTFLDMIPVKDISRTVEFIIHRARRIDPAIPVWVSQELATQMDGCKICGIRAIADELKQWSEDPQLATLRNGRDLATLAATVEGEVSRKEQTLMMMESQERNTQNTLLADYENLEDQKDLWEKMHKDFLSKVPVTRQAILNELGECRKELLEYLSSESPDTFNSRFRGRLSEKTSSISDKIRQQVWSDSVAFQSELGQRFQLPETLDLLPQKNLGLAYSVPVPIEAQPSGLMGLLMQFARKLWADAEKLLPVPPALSKHVHDMGNVLLDKLSQAYGGETDYAGQTKSLIDTFFNEMEYQVKYAVNALYGEMADHIRAEQTRWIREQRELLTRLHSTGELSARIDEYRKAIAGGRSLLAKLSGEHGARHDSR